MPNRSTAARRWLWGGVAVIGAASAIGGAWMLSLPAAREWTSPSPIPESETQALLAALAPPTHRRPLTVTIGINDATETTDYVMPYGILRRANVADVMLLATGAGPVKLFPALTVQPHATIAEFDSRHPEGADYVIVPAMSRDDDPIAIEWIRSQARKGAMIIGVCAGAKVVAETGLLDGKRATTHWYYLKEMLGKHPAVQYVADRRIVVDGRVATTTGISASMPLALTLIEAIAGRERAEAVGREIGVNDWDVRHDSGAFQFTRLFAATAIRNSIPFWNRETFGIELTPGLDEVSLAMVADAWSRTFRSRALTFAPDSATRESRNGLQIVPDQVQPSWPAVTQLPSVDQPPADALDEALNAIATRYGDRTTNFVAMQLEYPAPLIHTARATANGFAPAATARARQ